MLELEHACKHYASPGGSVRAVDDVSITVHARELVAVFGPSGSGKTTLLLLAAGLLRADAGFVRFDGMDLATLSKRDALHHRRTKLGFVFQDFNLVPGLSAEENVALPLLLRGVPRREACPQALGALSDVDLRQRAGHHPTQLSGGEQQRVSIARALVGSPTLVLADEPTGNLDSDTGDGILELLLGLPRERGTTTIVVTHDARVAGCADRMLTMRDGRLASPSPLPAMEIGR
jgi:ABC-type lipoprotein export system ATPase subunit